MAEFQVVAKELERMCNTYHAARKCNTDECPIYRKDLCYAQAMVHLHGDDACNLEKVVMSWAAENPEPIYPTWSEFLNQIGLPFYGDLNSRMSADIAQKLGIEPKEAK